MRVRVGVHRFARKFVSNILSGISKGAVHGKRPSRSWIGKGEFKALKVVWAFLFPTMHQGSFVAYRREAWISNALICDELCGNVKVWWWCVSVLQNGERQEFGCPPVSRAATLAGGLVEQSGACAARAIAGLILDRGQSSRPLPLYFQPALRKELAVDTSQ